MEQQQQKQQFLGITPKNKEIFKYIEELLVTYEFRDSQIQYFDKHCKTFENSEENKHVYHDLFKEYTEILDNTIDKKLAENFSESEIQEFYEDFTQDHKKYDIKSPWINTVETLFTFTDFENFKKAMIDYYQREHKGKESEQKPYKKLDVNPDFDTFHNYYNTDLSEFQAVLKGQKDDEIDTYTREHNDSVQVFVSRYTLKGVEEDTFLESFFKFDVEKIKAGIPFVTDMQQVYLDGETKSNDTQTIYSQYDYPMSGKLESLIRTQKSTYQDFKLLRQNSFEHESYPIRQDMKRLQMYKQVYCRQIPGTKNTEVVDITLGQREVGIPPIFLNMIIAKTTKNVISYFFNDLRSKQAEKDAKK